MKYTIIKPQSINPHMAEKHFSAAFDRLKDSDKKTAFESMVQDLKSGRATWYHLRSDSINLHMVTRVAGESLIIDAMQGKGMMSAALDIIRRARAMGYRSIQFETIKKGMRKMLAQFGFVEVERYDDGATLHEKKFKW